MIRENTHRRRVTLCRAVLFVSAAGCITMVVGCAVEVGMTKPATGDQVSFARDIQPIFTVNCAGCHSPLGAADLAGIRLKLTEGVAYELLVDQPSVQRADLTLVVPGDSALSLLYLKISQDAPPVGVRMPRFAPALSPLEIDLIQTWIDEGAMEN